LRYLKEPIMALPARIERGHESDLLDFNNMLSRFFGGRGLFGDDNDGGGPLAALANAVDIREDDDHIYIEADLPGFRKEDVDISLDDGMLTITAERREERVEPPPDGDQHRGQRGQQGQQGQPAQQGHQQAATTEQQQQAQRWNYLLRERRVQRFVRSFTLPPNVDPESVQAKLENGVLRLTLNKRSDGKGRHIQIS
jgi:HSP20 family protein